MGVYNRITEEKYNQLKQVLKSPADDAEVKKKYQVGRTTCQNVRNTKNYQEYCERVFRFHGHPKAKKVSTPAPRATGASLTLVRGALGGMLLMLGAVAIFVSLVGLLTSGNVMQPLWLVMLAISVGITLVLWRSEG